MSNTENNMKEILTKVADEGFTAVGISAITNSFEIIMINRQNIYTETIFMNSVQYILDLTDCLSKLFQLFGNHSKLAQKTVRTINCMSSILSMHHHTWFLCTPIENNINIITKKEYDKCNKEIYEFLKPYYIKNKRNELNRQKDNIIAEIQKLEEEK